MSDSNTAEKRPVSEKQLAANRSNATRSTGPRTPEGKARACMSRLDHGLFSSQEVLPGESSSEFLERRKALLDALNPGDALQELLSERAIDHAWKIKRGERAQDARATKTINNIKAAVAEREAREVARLAPLIETDLDAVRQLRTFPAGIDYLLGEWSIIHARMKKGKNPLFSQRMRCFQLLGRTWHMVLRSDPVATRLITAQISVICGHEATIENVTGFLGGLPPKGMPPEEFALRVKELKADLLPQDDGFVEFAKIVAEAIADLKALRKVVQAKVDRNAELDAVSALAESTPDGTRLANQIDKREKGMMAALRRVQLLQQPARPGPTRSPKKADATAAAAASPPAEMPADDPGTDPTGDHRRGRAGHGG